MHELAGTLSAPLDEGTIEESLRRLGSRLGDAVYRANRRRLATRRKGWGDWARAAVSGAATAAFRYVKPAASTRPAVARASDGALIARPAELLGDARRKLAAMLTGCKKVARGKITKGQLAPNLVKK